MTRNPGEAAVLPPPERLHGPSTYTGAPCHVPLEGLESWVEPGQVPDAKYVPALTACCLTAWSWTALSVVALILDLMDDVSGATWPLSAE